MSSSVTGNDSDGGSASQPDRKRRRMDNTNDNNDDDNNTNDNNDDDVAYDDIDTSRTIGADRTDTDHDALPFQPQSTQHSDDDSSYNSNPDPSLAGSEGSGENLIENADRDYQRIDALDTYGVEGMDFDANITPMSYGERLAAEQELNRRDRLALVERGDGGRGALDDVEMGEDEEARMERRKKFLVGHKRRREEEEVAEGDDPEMIGAAPAAVDVLLAEDEDEEEVNLEAFDVPLREWIAQNRTRSEIQRRFRRFLATFNDTTTPSTPKNRRKDALYTTQIRAMASSNLSSLSISYTHLTTAQPTLALWLVEAPSDMFDILDETATSSTYRLFPSYSNIRDEIHVRFTHYPITDGMRDLRRVHLERLQQVRGVVTRRTAVFPQLKLGYYDCRALGCGEIIGPIRVDPGTTDEGGGCGSCPKCQSTGPFSLNSSLSKYRNYQRVTLQETPGTVPAGRVPRSKTIILQNDLIDTCRPGEEVQILGIFHHAHNAVLSSKCGFQIYDTSILANNTLPVHHSQDAGKGGISPEDRELIRKLGRDPMIGQRIVNSIAPSIHGHPQVKMAIAMSLVSGVPKNVNDKHRIRGDINVLLLGDPGVAKSQVLKYAEKTAPRAVYSTGKGASAVGLTASVHKDPVTREWTLEGGALVLADRGLCLIDEFDKMNEQDRTSIHEAMEQQTISISKAGIVTSLQARCAVIAAANPIGGRYDSSLTLAENVELTDPILQRFDILCVLQDRVDPVEDERLAKFVTGSHMRSTPTNELSRPKEDVPLDTTNNPTPADPTRAADGTLPQELLRKYILYARTHIHPKLSTTSFDQNKLTSLYTSLRRESAVSGGVPIAVRHIESILRMSEAHARLHLREYVREDDVDAAIDMMLQSFLGAQKFSVRKSLRKKFEKFLVRKEDGGHLLLHLLQDLFRNESLYQNIRRRRKKGKKDAAMGSKDKEDEDAIVLEVPLDEFEARAKESKVYNVLEFCQSREFVDAGYELDQRKGVIRRN